MRWLLSIGLAAVTACGGGTEPVPLEEFSAAARDSVCAWALRCQHVPDRPTCERLLDPKQYDTRRTEDAVAAGRMAWDAEAAGRCLAATAGAYCLTPPFSDDSCGDMIEGLVATGGGCTSSFECAGGADCENPQCGSQCCLGSCGPALTGEPPPEEPGAAIGEACQSHDDCADGGYCETDRTCAAMPDAEGERCLFGCLRGDLYCDLEELVCKRYGAAGEACDPDGVSAPPCDPAWSFCDQSCRPRPGPGEPCDGIRQCIASAYCDFSGVCQARGTAGDSCDNNNQCQVACDGSTCTEYTVCTTDSL